MQRQTQFNIGYVLFAVFAILLLQQFWQQAQTVEVVPYSEFEKLLAENKIEEVVISDKRITGKLKGDPDGRENGGRREPASKPDLAERLSKYGVSYTASYESTFLRDLLSWVVPVLVFFGVWMLLVRRMAGHRASAAA